jgi:hypothetical protein
MRSNERSPISQVEGAEQKHLRDERESGVPWKHGANWLGKENL